MAPLPPVPDGSPPGIAATGGGSPSAALPRAHHGSTTAIASTSISRSSKA